MVNSQGNKADFVPFKQIGERVFEIRWGKTDIVERVRVQEGEEWVETGEVKETDYCSYTIERIYGEKPSAHVLTKMFDKSNREPSMAEMKTIGEGFGMTEEQMVPWMKENMKRAIEKYDSSSEVNAFTINGINVWLDKSTRVGLLLRFQSEQAQGKTETTLWYEGMAFPLTIEDGINMLYAIEGYASASYDHTQQLYILNEKMASVDEYLSFDFKSGYPSKLAF